jgi:hypothetical protein
MKKEGMIVKRLFDSQDMKNVGIEILFDWNAMCGKSSL